MGFKVPWSLLPETVVVQFSTSLYQSFTKIIMRNLLRQNMSNLVFGEISSQRSAISPYIRYMELMISK